MTTVTGTTESSSQSAVFGSNSATAATPEGTVAGYGVFGLTTVPNASGVFGANNGGGTGVAGESANGTGVIGTTQSSSSNGVFGSNSATAATPEGTVAGYGVFGLTTVPNASGVFGANNGGGTGVAGESANGTGVIGTTQSSSSNGVFGSNSATAATPEGTVAGYGVFGLTTVPNASGVFGANNGGGTGISAVSSNGTGLFATGGKFAAVFDGNVQCNGDHQCTGTMTVNQDIVLSNADCAEEFDVTSSAKAEPGTVMVIGDDEALRPSSEPYDRRVAGVVSGGGDYKSALLLDRRASVRPRSAVALFGKVYCKADAQQEPINVGDLLTTSPTPGHAMRASDQRRAFGAVIGKALQPLTSGQGLIAILVSLQ